MQISRRNFLFGAALLIPACRAASRADVLSPTPFVPDEDGPTGPMPLDRPGASCAATADNIEGPFYKAGAPHRATLVTDAHGRYAIRTLVPGRYLNGKRYRPSHIHVKLRAKGREELTTQLYFDGDPYIDGDPFVVSSLVMAHRRDGNVRKASFDFVI